MQKPLKYIGITAASLVGLLVVAFIVLKLISDDQYNEWLTSAVQSATGRDFSIDDLEIDLNTSLRVKANSVRLANAEWSDRPDMLSVGHLEADVDLLSLLGGVAEIRTVIEKTDVIAETNADGDSNWALKPAQRSGQDTVAEVDSGSGGLPLRPLIREFRIEDFTVTFVDGVKGKDKRATIENFLLETTQKESNLSFTGLVADLPLELSGNLGHIDEVLDQAPSPINLDGRIGQSSLNISGTWGPLLPDPNLELDLNVDIPSTTKLTTLAGLDLAELGAVKLDAKLSADNGHFSIARIITNLDGEVAAVSAKGTISNLTALSGIDLSVEAGTSVLGELMADLNLKIPAALPADVKVSAQVQGGLDQLGIKDFKAEIRDEGVLITASGTVTHALDQSGLDATFDVKVDSTAALSKYARLDLPDLGAIDASGRMLSKDKTLSLTDLNALLDGGNLNMQIKAGVADLIKTDGIEADLKLDISSISGRNIAELEHLLKQLEVDIPLDVLPSSAKVSAKASGGLEKLSVTGIDAEVRDEGILVTLAGAIANAITQEGVDATLTLKSESVSALSKYARMNLPEVGALEITGQLLSRDRTYRLENLDAKLTAEDFNVALAAAVDDLLAVQGIDATMDATVSSLDALSALAQTELPATDPVALHAVISSEGKGGAKPTAISIRAETAGAVANVDGTLADLKSINDITLALQIEAESLSDFSKLAQKELPEQGPLKLTGTVRTQPNEYSLDDLQLSLDDQSLNGSLGIKVAESDDQLSTLKGELIIPYLDLTPFLLGKPEEEPVADQTETPVATVGGTKADKEEQELARETDPEQIIDAVEGRLFSNEPLRLGPLRKIDADFSVTAGRLKLGKTDMTDFNIVLSLKNGLLRVDPISALAGPGTINGNLQLDGRGDAAKLAVDIILDDIPMPNLGGGLQFNSRLDGEGDSIAAIMGGLDGRILIVVQDAVIPNSFATNFGSGLFSFSGGKDQTELECGILRVEIVDGHADFEDKLAAQLRDVTWRGGGEINLKTEELDAGIVPKPRKGIGIGAGSLAGLVHVGGTLKNPQVQLDPKDVAVKYGKYMAYVSTGGLSLLAEAVINKSKANIDVCEQILDGTVFDEDADSERATESEEPAQSEPSASLEDETEMGQLPETETQLDANEQQGAAQGKQAEEAPAEDAAESSNKKKRVPTSKNFQ